MIVKAAKEKDQVTYRGKPISTTPDIPRETLKARRAWADALQMTADQKCHQATIPAKLPVRLEGLFKISFPCLKQI